MADDDNRRQAVRVTDRILFSFETISVDEYEVIALDYSQGIPPYKQEGLAEIQMYVGAQNSLARIRENNSDLADFLQHLDTKVNRILKEVRGEKTLFDKLDYHEVVISGTGLSFQADEEMAIKTPLVFHIVLLPNYTYIYCFGKVVKCEPVERESGETRFQISAKFTILMEEDGEKIIRHNFKQQAFTLRQRRQG